MTRFVDGIRKARNIGIHIAGGGDRQRVGEYGEMMWDKILSNTYKLSKFICRLQNPLKLVSPFFELFDFMNYFFQNCEQTNASGRNGRVPLNGGIQPGNGNGNERDEGAAYADIAECCCTAGTQGEEEEPDDQVHSWKRGCWRRYAI